MSLPSTRISPRPIEEATIRSEVIGDAHDPYGAIRGSAIGETIASGPEARIEPIGEAQQCWPLPLAAEARRVDCIGELGSLAFAGLGRRHHHLRPGSDRSHDLQLCLR